MTEVEEFRKTLIEKFEDLKKKAPTFRDAIYLDGVLAVIETHNLNKEEPPVSIDA